LLPASFAWLLSIFWVCEGSIPNPPNSRKGHSSGRGGDLLPHTPIASGMVLLCPGVAS
jgi:hypothetical protein